MSTLNYNFNIIDKHTIKKYPELTHLALVDRDNIKFEDILENPALLLLFPTNYDLHLKVIKKIPMAIRYVQMPSEELCIEAVKRNGNAIMFIQSGWYYKKYCLIAVEKTPSSIQYMSKEDEEVCIKALSKSGKVLKLIKNQTRKKCLVAVNQDGNALQFVNCQDLDVCLKAVMRTPSAIKHIRDKEMQIQIYNYIKDNITPDKLRTINRALKIRNK